MMYMSQSSQSVNWVVVVIGEIKKKFYDALYVYISISGRQVRNASEQ